MRDLHRAAFIHGAVAFCKLGQRTLRSKDLTPGSILPLSTRSIGMGALSALTHGTFYRSIFELSDMNAQYS
ncbi:hypothetical protein FJ955_22455 [Mesorhizobium sp. B2-2-2]|nr:hypothetical protein FJ955_22455 [Mesorhizobium sp. B2-2-2]